MTTLRWLCVSFSIVCVVSPLSAAADEVIVIVGDAPRGGPGDLDGEATGDRDRGRALGDAPFVTIVHADDHAGELASLADVVARTVGTEVRGLGGLGSFASLSVRGAPPGHTVVMVDGVPLSRIASVTADLGRFELDAIDQVELYRGAVPVELGGAGTGGALHLITRLGRGSRGERVRVSAGTGSFGARHLRARAGDELAGGRLRGMATVGYTGATGDYRYFSDGGTALIADDDAWLERANNRFDQIDGALRLGGGGDRAPAGGVRVVWRDQGLPGSAWAPSMSARLSTTGAIADGSAWSEIGPTTGQHRGFAAVESQHYADRDGEVGLGLQDRRYRSLSIGGTTAWAMPVGRHRGTAAIDARVDAFRDRDLLMDRPRVTGNRETGGAAAAIDLAVTDRLALVPAIRIDAARTDPALDPDAPGDSAAAVRWETPVSPRLSARWLVRPEVAIKGSAGRYARLPTVIELFGDRGFIVGSPGLRPETGITADAGVVWAPAHRLGAFDRIVIEAAGFVGAPRDTIALVNTIAGVARAHNTGDTRSIGVELVAGARIDDALTIAANYTLLDAIQRAAEPSFDGKRLPRQPRHAAYARADFATRIESRLAVVWADVDWQSTSYLDRANLLAVPGRTLVGGGVKGEIGGGVLLGLEVRNLTDHRLVDRTLDPAPRPDLASVPMAAVDVAGFPLPGRAFYATVEWTY